MTTTLRGCPARGVDPPGPKGLPFVGAGLHMRLSPLALFMGAVSEYGDVVRLPLLRLPLTPMEPKNQVIVVNHPDLVTHVCVTGKERYRTHKLLIDKLRATLRMGEGELLTSTGEAWRKRKRVLQPSFQGKAIAAISERIKVPIRRMLAAWGRLADGAVVDVEHDFTRLVTDTFALLFLSLDLGGADADLREDWDRTLAGISERMAMPFTFLQKVPTRRNSEYERAFAAVGGRIGRIVAARRRGERAGDMLDAWLDAAVDEGDATFDASAAKDQILLLLLAGRKNVANAMAWGAHLLSRHAGCARKLQAEVDEVLSGREPEAADLATMGYLEATRREILRLYPTAWLIARMALEDDLVGGYKVPAGAVVFMSPYTLHRHLSFWDDPDSFDPERFRDAGTRDRAQAAYVPFGVGPRTCIGKALSELMIELVLTMIAQRFTLSPKPGHVARIKATSSLHPSGGMPMIIRRRPARGAADA